MGSRDRRVDAYIAQAAPFARPILTQLREVVHEACPDVEETMEWVGEAKRDETRVTRIQKTVAQLKEKKSLHWKYAKC